MVPHVDVDENATSSTIVENNVMVGVIVDHQDITAQEDTTLEDTVQEDTVQKDTRKPSEIRREEIAERRRNSRGNPPLFEYAADITLPCCTKTVLSCSHDKELVRLSKSTIFIALMRVLGQNSTCRTLWKKVYNMKYWRTKCKFPSFERWCWLGPNYDMIVCPYALVLG